MPAKFHLRKDVVFDDNQRLVLDATTYKGYLTAISKNALTGAPIVICPLDLRREQWMALSEHCRAVAVLLSGRSYKQVRKEMY